MRVIAFGDSTTARRSEAPVYADLLQTRADKVGLPLTLRNAGVPGDTTAVARERFDREVLRQRPHAVIIQFGLNDAAVDVWKLPPATEPRVSIGEFHANLIGFVLALQQRGASALLMTPNPMAWRPTLRELYGQPPYDPSSPRGMAALLYPYVGAVREVASETGTPLVDVFAAYLALPEADGFAFADLLPDGIHPSEAGHHLVAELLWPEIASLAGAGFPAREIIVSPTGPSESQQ